MSFPIYKGNKIYFFRKYLAKNIWEVAERIVSSWRLSLSDNEWRKSIAGDQSPGNNDTRGSSRGGVLGHFR